MGRSNTSWHTIRTAWSGCVAPHLRACPLSRFTCSSLVVRPPGCGGGIYRVEEAPVDGLSEFATAVALVGADVVLADESVLAAHDLAWVIVRAHPGRNGRAGTSVACRRPLRWSHAPCRPICEIELDGVRDDLAAATRARRGRVMTRLISAARQADARGLIDQREAEANRTRA